MKQKLKKLLSVENASKVFVMMLCVGAMNITANAAEFLSECDQIDYFMHWNYCYFVGSF